MLAVARRSVNVPVKAREVIGDMANGGMKLMDPLGTRTDGTVKRLPGAIPILSILEFLGGRLATTLSLNPSETPPQ
jgi:hypothetical protein